MDRRTPIIQRQLTTTLTRFEYGRGVIRQAVIANTHASDACVVKIFLIPVNTDKKGTDAQHALFCKSVAAQSTEIFQPKEAIPVPETFELGATASADSKLTLTLVR